MGSGDPRHGEEPVPSATPQDAAAPEPGEMPIRRPHPGGGRCAWPPRPRWDQAYAVLRIPRIGIRVPVAEGVSRAAY